MAELWERRARHAAQVLWAAVEMSRVFGLLVTELINRNLLKTDDPIVRRGDRLRSGFLLKSRSTQPLSILWPLQAHAAGGPRMNTTLLSGQGVDPSMVKDVEQLFSVVERAHPMAACLMLAMTLCARAKAGGISRESVVQNIRDIYDSTMVQVVLKGGVA